MQVKAAAERDVEALLCGFETTSNRSWLNHGLFKLNPGASSQQDITSAKEIFTVLHLLEELSKLERTSLLAGRRFTPVGEGGSGRRPLPPQSLNILIGLTLKLLSLYCIVGLV